MDLSGKTLDKKVLEHSLYNYILVVGGVEKENQSVNVRKRKEGEDNEQVGRDREVPLDDFIKELHDLVAQHKRKFLLYRLPSRRMAFLSSGSNSGSQHQVSMHSLTHMVSQWSRPRRSLPTNSGCTVTLWTLFL